MGYYADYFSTLLKSPWAVAYKERWDSRRVVRYSKKADKFIYGTLPKEVVQHRVTAALKDHKKAREALEHVSKYGLQLAFNASVEEEILLRTIKHLIESMDQFHQTILTLKTTSKIGNKEEVFHAELELETLSAKFAKIMAEQATQAQQEEQEEMRQVMVLIEQSHTMDKDRFMAAVKQKFTSLKSQSMLAKYAFRFDIQHEKKFIKRLKRLSKWLDELRIRLEKIAKINKKYKELPEIVGEFNNIIEESKDDIKKAFYASYQIKKRDFSLLLSMLVNTNVLEAMDRKWIKMHYLPELSTEKEIENLEALKKKLGEKLHVSAQALRISMRAEEDLKKQVLPLYYKK